MVVMSCTPRAIEHSFAVCESVCENGSRIGQKLQKQEKA